MSKNNTISALTGKSGIICNAIEDRLINGHYKFGQEILVNDLVSEFGASRAPVMAALGYLRDQGYLIITPQVGCRVINPTPQEIDDFFFIYGRVEGAIATIAAQRHVPADISLLRATQQQIKSLTPRKGEVVSPAFVNMVADYHRQIHAMTHSKWEMGRAEKFLRVSQFFLFNGNHMRIKGGTPLSTADRERAAIVDAIAARDEQLACRLMEEHIQGKQVRVGLVLNLNT